jgi:hypothetical protein
LMILAVKIYEAASGGAQEKGKTTWNSVYHQNWLLSEFHPLLNANVLFLQWKTTWNSVYHQNWWLSEFHPLLNANVLFLQFKKKSHPVYDQTQGYGAVFFLLYG